MYSLNCYLSLDCRHTEQIALRLRSEPKMASTTRAVVQPTIRRPGGDDVIGSPCSPWVQRKRHVTDDDTCADYDKENDDYCYMPSTTPKMRKTAEGKLSFHLIQ